MKQKIGSEQAKRMRNRSLFALFRLKRKKYKRNRLTLLVVCAGDAGRGGDTPGEVLRHGGRVQRHGDGAAGAQPGGPLQLLQQAANQNIKFINKFKVSFKIYFFWEDGFGFC